MTGRPRLWQAQRMPLPNGRRAGSMAGARRTTMRDFQKPGRSLVYATERHVRHLAPARGAGGGAASCRTAATPSTPRSRRRCCSASASRRCAGSAATAFVLLKPPGEERLVGLNGSGRAPAALDAEALRAEGHAAMPTESAAAVTVPGAVDAFARLAADWGRLGLAASLAPAIALRRGRGSRSRRAPPATGRQAASRRSPATHAGYYLSRRRARPSPASVFRAPGQAEVLRRIARDGRAGFYEGEVAEDMVASLRALGGAHTARGLRRHRLRPGSSRSPAPTAATSWSSCRRTARARPRS